MKLSKLFLSIFLSSNLFAQDSNQAKVVTQFAVGAGLFLGATASIFKAWLEPARLPNFSRRYQSWQAQLSKFQLDIERAADVPNCSDLILSELKYTEISSRKWQAFILKCSQDTNLIERISSELDHQSLLDFVFDLKREYEHLCKIKISAERVIQKIGSLIQRKNLLSKSSKFNRQQKDFLSNHDNEIFYLDNFSTLIVKIEKIAPKLEFNYAFLAKHANGLLLFKELKRVNSKYSQLLDSRKVLGQKYFTDDKMLEFAKCMFLNESSCVFELARDIKNDIDNLIKLKHSLLASYSFDTEVEDLIKTLEVFKQNLVHRPDFFTHKHIYEINIQWQMNKAMH